MFLRTKKICNIKLKRNHRERPASINQERTVLSLRVPVKWRSMCHGRFSSLNVFHVCSFFRLLLIPQYTVYTRQVPFYPSGVRTLIFFITSDPKQKLVFVLNSHRIRRKKNVVTTNANTISFSQELYVCFFRNKTIIQKYCSFIVKRFTKRRRYYYSLLRAYVDVRIFSLLVFYF